MPELAEVQTLADQLHDVAAGRTILHVELLHPPLLSFGDPASLNGRTLTGVARWGKRLRFDCDGPVAVLGLGMTGGVRAGGDQPAHTVARIDLTAGLTLWLTDVRKFGRLHIFSCAEQAHQQLDGRIGPDAASAMTAAQLRTALGRGTLKGCLLDQSKIAALGNYMVDEICHRAGVQPARHTTSLTDTEWEAVNQARMLMVALALRHGGLSFSDYRHADGSQGRMIDHLRVYRRAGQPCLTCATPIRKTVVAGRGTHDCPSCQT